MILWSWSSSWMHSARSLIGYRVMAPSFPFTALASSLLSVVVVVASSPPLVEAAPRNAFPGRRVGGGTRGECASRPIVHLVPTSSVFAPGAPALIAWLEGPSANPKPLQVTLRAASAEGRADPQAAPVLTRELPAAANRLTLLQIPTPSGALLWESSYRCGDGSGGEGSGGDGSGDEFGFITASAPPALSLLVPQGDSGDEAVHQTLLGLKASCGGTTRLAPLKAAFQLSDGDLNGSWPATVKVQCF